jgi:hypothetical protein
MKERLGASLVLAGATDICWAAYGFLEQRKEAMDQSPINQNFELNKSRQKFHHSLKSITKLVVFQSFVLK